MGNSKSKSNRIAAIEVDEEGNVLSTQVGNIKLDYKNWERITSIASDHWILMRNYQVKWNGTVLYVPGKYVELFIDLLDDSFSNHLDDKQLELTSRSLNIYKNGDKIMYVLI